MKDKWRRLILFFFLWSVLIRVQFYSIFIFLFDPSWSDPDWRSELIRSDFCTCLAKMFVCPVPKISHVIMKWCRRASHLGRFTLWNNGRRRASHLGRFTVWNNGRRATQLGRFTLWHCGRLGNSVDLLCGTTDAELHNSQVLKFTLWLHNSVDLLCGTTPA